MHHDCPHPPFSFGRNIGFTVKGLSHQIKRFIDNSAQKNGIMPLTGMQHAVIGYISSQSAKRDVFQKDVESKFNIRRSTATGILQLMERDRLINREPVPYDARLKKLVLTPRATKLQKQIHADILAMETQMIQGIPEEDLDVFFRVIAAIEKNIQ